MPLVFENKQGVLPTFNQALEDIEVYKIVRRDHRLNSLSSLYNFDCWWTMGIKKIKNFGLFEMRPNLLKKNKVFYISTEGIYSFKNLLDAKRYKENISWSFDDGGACTLVLYKAIVPAGAIYVEKGYQMMSNELLLKEEI